MSGSLLELVDFPMLWLLAIAMVVIGLGLSVFYAWLYWRSLTTGWEVKEDDTPVTVRVQWLCGWCGGAAFLGGALIFILPLRMGEFALVVAGAWVLLYFLVAAVIRRRASSRGVA